MRSRYFVAFVLIVLASLYVWAETDANHRARQIRPIKLGTSGGNNDDSTSEFCCSGTLGAVVKNANGIHYILSNNHVLAKNNQGLIGQFIGQPGLIDVRCSSLRAEPVARLSKFIRIRFDRPNRVDAAIAEVIPGTVSPSGKILDIGIPGTPVEPAVGMLVKKSGRTTGKTVGIITAIHVTLQVQIPVECGDDQGRVARFADQFIVENATTRRFSGAGDSGALIVTKKSSCPNPVGLLFAGDESGLTVGNRIQRVLNRLNVSIVGCGIGAPASGTFQGTRLDPSIEQAEKIRQRYEDRLLRIPGIMGVGIAANHQSTTGWAIVVFVQKNSASATSQNSIPAQLENMPVRTILTTGFKAL